MNTICENMKRGGCGIL